ncbi:rapid alkalinization factor [Tanacetum coccineum]
MFRGGTSPIIRFTLIVSTTIVVLMMIKDSDGSMTACNGSTAAECELVHVEEEEEFMMDTEAHRRILVGKNDHISLNSLEKGKQGCRGTSCAGKYDPANRKCTLFDRSCK